MIRQLFAEIEERRDKVQVLADIIKVAKQPAKITKILRVANIQYNTFQECIDKLNSAGLLQITPVEKEFKSFRDKRTSYVFEATDMGLKWCEMVEEVYTALEEDKI